MPSGENGHFHDFTKMVIYYLIDILGKIELSMFAMLYNFCIFVKYSYKKVQRLTDKGLQKMLYLFY